MTEKKVAVRVVAEGGQLVRAEFTNIGREGQRALEGIESASRRTGAAMQNVGFQVQDFAVQVAGGTSASRAFAQQLPQLLSGFGLWGVALGTVTALLPLFVSGVMDGADAAEGLEEGLDDLQHRADALTEAVRRADAPMAELEAQFGRNAAAVRELYDAQVKLAQLDFLAAQNRVSAGMREAFSELSLIVEDVRNLQSVAASNLPGAAPLQISQSLEVLQGQFGLTLSEAEALKAALDQLGDARGPQAVFDAAVALQSALLAAADDAGNLPPEIEAAYRNAVDLQTAAAAAGLEIHAAADAGASLNDTNMSDGLRSALSVAQQLALATRAALFPNSPGRGDPRKFVNDPYWQEKYFPKPVKFDLSPARSSGGGGGGGVSDEQREYNELMREAERVIAATRTEAEKYKDEIAKLDEMLAANLLTQDQYDKALDQLKQRFSDIDNEAAKTKDSFKEFFSSIISGSDSAGEALSNLLSSFADRMASAGFDALWGLLFPSANGNVFSGGDVMAFANGGVVGGPTLFPMRHGGIGLMGEAGPEAIMPLQRGADGRLGVISSGQEGSVAVTVQVNVDARGAVEGVAAQVSEAVRRQVPDIVKQAVAGVGEARRRGYPV